MVLSGREIARGFGGRTVVRPEPMRTRLRLADLPAADAHVVHVTFHCSVQALDQPVEKQMLTETFLRGVRAAVTVDEVMEHFAPALRAAAARLTETQPADHWTSDSARPALVEALRNAAKPIAFNCGVDLVAPFDVAVESPTLQREKLESIQRKLVERRAAGQAEHVARAAELLRQFETLRQAAPQLSPGSVIEQVSPGDRGSMLETLLMASANASGQPALWAVAGPNLVKIDPRPSPPRCDIIPLPGDLGPLRSVRAGEVAGVHGLLIGAQNGVLFVDPASPGQPRCYADRAIASPLGFNSAAATDDMIWATHGEGGVVAWRIDGAGDTPELTLRPDTGVPRSSGPAGAGSAPRATGRDPGSVSVIHSMNSTGSGSTGLSGSGPRNVVRLDDRRILYSAGANVYVSDRAEPLPLATSSENVVLVAVDERSVLVVRAGGQFERLDRDTLHPLDGVRRAAGQVSSAGVLPWLGTTRLLLATSDGPVLCVGADDSLVTQYVGPHRGLRAVTAAADVVAAINADRTRLVVWKSWDGRQPAAEVHLAAVARHRAADVCFA